MNLLIPALIVHLFGTPAGSTGGDSAVSVNRPAVTAVRTHTPIVIDGILDEAGWNGNPVTGFTQREPLEGHPPSHPTDVWILYDDEALYVGARLHDARPDSIVRRVGRRDGDELGDWFYFGIDSYLDRRTGFFFGIYASGSIVDGTLYNDEWDDEAWDGVWESATNVDEGGWSVEMRIPYNQIRFPSREEYVWGVNFARGIDRFKEEDYYVMVPKTESGWVSRFADLRGIRDIDPPGRVELLPYVVSGTRRWTDVEPGDPFNDGRTWIRDLGVDFKLGLGSNLTVNATVNPDFGQVEVDPAVVNLSAFETFYQEKRPFFIEGSSLFSFGNGGANSNSSFNFGNPDLFYSRRIGRPPQGETQHEGYVDRPDATTILGAGKLTGKIGGDWSLGAMTAVTQREYATVQDDSGRRYSDIIEPLTGYGVLRLLGEFDDGKRGLGFMGTTTLRDLEAGYLRDQFNGSAYVLGADGWTNLDAGGEYVLTGWMAGSTVNGSPERLVSVQRNSLHYFQRPDADHVRLDSSRTSLSGYGGRFAVNKQKGNVRFNAAIGVLSPGLEVNDAGFGYQTDRINAHIMTGYRWLEPDGVFRSKQLLVAVARNYNFSWDKTSEGAYFFLNGQTMDYFSFNGNFFYMPATLDQTGTRGGVMMMNTNRYETSVYGNTDSRMLISYGMGLSGGQSASGGYRISVDPNIMVKPSAGFSVRLEPGFTRDITVAQFVKNQEDPTAGATYGTRHVFGRIDQREFSAGIRVDWTFTPRLSLQLYLQPLISVGSYTDFKELRAPRTYTFNRYGRDNGSTVTYDEGDRVYTVDPDGTGPAAEFTFDDPDFNFKSLRGNAVLRWEFLPGSTAFLVWTQSRTGDEDPGSFSFGRDFRNLVRSGHHENIFLLKIAYWWHP